MLTISPVKRSVVVRYLYIECIAIPPHEAHAELVVDPNAMRSLSFPTQCFQTITRWCGQIPQFRGAVQLPDLPAGGLFDSPKAPTALALVKPLCLGTPERPDHKCIVSCLAYNVKRYIVPITTEPFRGPEGPVSSLL